MPRAGIFSKNQNRTKKAVLHLSNRIEIKKQIKDLRSRMQNGESNLKDLYSKLIHILDKTAYKSFVKVSNMCCITRRTTGNTRYGVGRNIFRKAALEGKISGFKKI